MGQEKLFGTHSLRRGGATSLANNNVNKNIYRKKVGGMAPFLQRHDEKYNIWGI